MEKRTRKILAIIIIMLNTIGLVFGSINVYLRQGIRHLLVLWGLGIAISIPLFYYLIKKYGTTKNDIKKAKISDYE